MQRNEQFREMMTRIIDEASVLRSNLPADFEACKVRMDTIRDAWMDAAKILSVTETVVVNLPEGPGITMGVVDADPNALQTDGPLVKDTAEAPVAEAEAPAVKSKKKNK